MENTTKQANTIFVDNWVWMQNEENFVEVAYRIGNVWRHKEFKGQMARTLAHRFSNKLALNSERKDDPSSPGDK